MRQKVISGYIASFLINHPKDNQADVVEAMASYRLYRPALGIEAALEEIEKNKGILYDSQVVEVCLRSFREKGFRFE